MKCTPCKMKTFFPVKHILFIRSLADAAFYLMFPPSIHSLTY